MKKENTMKKRILGLLISLIAVLSIMSCDKINELKQPGAEAVLGNYLEASLKRQSEKAYGYISAEDKAIKPLSEYKTETVCFFALPF